MIRKIDHYEWFEGEAGLRMLVMHSESWQRSGDPPFYYITIFDGEGNPLAFETGSTHQRVGTKPWEQGKPYPYNPIEAMKEHMAELGELKRITSRKPPWEK